MEEENNTPDDNFKNQHFDYPLNQAPDELSVIDPRPEIAAEEQDVIKPITEECDRIVDKGLVPFMSMPLSERLKQVGFLAAGSIFGTVAIKTGISAESTNDVLATTISGVASASYFGVAYLQRAITSARMKRGERI